MHLLRELANLQLDTCTKWLQWTLKAGGRVCPSSYCNIATQTCRGRVTHHSNLTCRLLYSHSYRLPSKKIFGDFKSDKIWMHQKKFFDKNVYHRNFQIYIILLFLLNAICLLTFWKLTSVHPTFSPSDTKFRTLIYGQCSRPVSEEANLNQNVSDLF